MAQNNPFFGNPLDKVTDEIRAQRFELPDFSEVAATPDAAAGTSPGGSDGLLPPPEYEPLFVGAGQKYQVPINVLMALGQQESSYNPQAIGPQTKWGKAKGMMQYIDPTAEGMGIDPLDPAQAVEAAAIQFKERLDKGYSVEEAIMAHHGGDNRAQWGPKTRQYLKDVLGKAGAIREQWQPPQRPEGVTSTAIQSAEDVAPRALRAPESAAEGLPQGDMSASPGDKEARAQLEALRDEVRDPGQVDAMTGADLKTQDPNAPTGGTPLDLIRKGLESANDFLQTPASEIDFLNRRPEGPSGEEKPKGGLLGDVTGGIDAATRDPGEFTGERARNEAPDAFTGADIKTPDTDWQGWVTNLAKEVTSGAIGSTGSSVEGLGLIGQQLANVEAGRQVTEAARKFDSARQTLAQTLEANKDQDPQTALKRAQGHADRVTEAEIEFHKALVEEAERNPGKIAGWLREKGVDIGKLAQELKADPEYQGVATDLASGVGSMLTYLGPGFVTTLMTRGSTAAVRGIAGIAGASALAGPAGAAEAYQRAKEYGLPEEEAVRISMQGIPAGVVQVAPVATILKKIPQGIRGKAISQFRHLLESFGAEFTAEGAGAVLQNLVEKSYNAEKGVWDDSLYQAAIGGSSAALISLGVQLATRGKGIGPIDAGDLGGELQKNIKNRDWASSPEMEALRLMDPEAYLGNIREQVETAAGPEAILAGDIMQPEGPAPEGPIERAAVETVGEEKVAQVPGERVTVETRTGKIAGTVEDYYEDGQGNFQAQVLSDDGEVYVFDRDSQAVILRDEMLGEDGADAEDGGSDTAGGPADVPPMANVEAGEAPGESDRTESGGDDQGAADDAAATEQLDPGYAERATYREQMLEQVESEQDVQDLIDAEIEDKPGFGTQRRQDFVAAAEKRIEAVQKEQRQKRQEAAEALRRQNDEQRFPADPDDGSRFSTPNDDIRLMESSNINPDTGRGRFVATQRSTGRELATGLTQEDAFTRAEFELEGRSSQPSGETAPTGEPVVEHVTRKGKTKRGVVRDVPKAEATAIDPYAFKKDGGWFINLSRLPEEQQGKPVEAEGPDTENEQTVTQDAGDKPLEVKSDGNPFASYETAQRAAKNRKIDGTPVQVDGGWAIQRGEASTQEPAPATDAITRDNAEAQLAPARWRGDQAKTVQYVNALMERGLIEGSPQLSSARDAGDYQAMAEEIDRQLAGEAVRPTTVDTAESPGSAAARQRARNDRTPPIADARREDRKRDTRKQGREAALEGDPRELPEWLKGDAELEGEFLAGYGEGIAQRSQQQAESKPQASENTVFTEDAAEKARALLKSKLGQINSGLDPEMFQAGIVLAGYHVERGARSFAAYARAMVDDLGEAVKPHLKQFYMGLKYDPRATGFEGMDAAADVDAADVDAVLAETAEAPAEPAQEATQEAAEATDLEGAQVTPEVFAELMTDAEAAEDQRSPFVTAPKITRAADAAKQNGTMSLEDAQERVESWKAHARAQGESGVNSGKVVLSLFEVSGELTRPWVEAGYDVQTFDIQTGTDIAEFDVERLMQEVEGGLENVHAVLACPPCTDFAGSGARWWAEKDTAGKTEASKDLVRQVLNTIELVRPPVWMIENPVGRMARVMGMPHPTLTFQPHHYGDPFTKKTLLWGDFNPNLPQANVDPSQGSRVHKLSGRDKDARSETPKGFAYAFFMANNAADMTPAELLSREFRGMDPALFAQSVDAGLTPERIRSLIEDDYNDANLEAAESILRDATRMQRPEYQAERQRLKERQEEVSATAQEGDARTQAWADLQFEYAEQELRDQEARARVEEPPREERQDDPQGDSAAGTQPLVDTTPESHVPADPDADPERVDGVRPSRETGDGQPESDRTRRGDGLERGEVAGTPGAADTGGSGTGDAAAGPGGGHRAPASDSLNRSEDRPHTLAGESPGNFVIPDDFKLGQGSDGTKIKDNLAALEVMLKASAENRFATPAEQKILARYVGWGGLGPVFDPKNRGTSNQYGRAHAWLKEHLTKEQFAAAKRSIQDSHYTSDKVVGMMWKAARHFGFKGGRALEPTVGTGNFLGLEPADLAGATEWHASELDDVSGRIAQLLYPEANVLAATGFQDAPFADGVMDLAIGNPPFGSQPIRDRSKRRAHLDGMKIHNYIIAKAGMHLRPGGVMQMVVTHRFLDTADPEGRRELAKHFRLLGAVRLPNDAFKATAGTEVTTDMVYLQKLREGEAPDAGASWLDTDGQIEVDGVTMRVNRYFQEHPENILGKSSMAGSMYRGQGQEYTVESDGRDIAQAFDKILTEGSLADLANVMEQSAIDRDGQAVMLEQSDLPVGGMTLTPEGTIIQRDLDDAAGNSVINEVTPESYWKEKAAQWGDAIDAVKAIKAAREDGRPVSPEMLKDLEEAAQVATKADGGKKPKPTKAEQALYDVMDAAVNPTMAWAFDEGLAAMEATLQRKQLGRKGYDTLRKLLDLRGKTLALLRAERTDAADMEAKRRELNQAYDAFVKAYGLISEPGNLALLAGDVGVEVGLETGYQPAIKPAEAKAMGTEPRKASASKADILQRRVTWPEKVIDHADNALDGLNISLSEKGKLDLPYIAELTGKPEGEVINELQSEEAIFYDMDAMEFVTADEYLSGNVKHKLQVAIENSQDDNVAALEKVQPEPKTQDNVTPSIRGTWLPSSLFEDFLSALGLKSPRVLVQPSIGRISAREAYGEPTELGLQFSDPDVSMVQLFNAASSGKSLKVMRKDSDGNSFEDKGASQRVTAKAERMAQVFAEWAYSEGDRAQAVVDAYNRVMNTHRQRAYNGEKYLKPVGQSPTVKLRRTQKNAAWRMIQSNAVLTDHVVGAGKAQPLDAKILTPSGWVRMGDIQPGDKVIARNGQATEVEAVFPQGEKEIFRVTFSDGSSTECCEEHLWLTQTYRERGYAQRAAREGREWPCAQGKVRSLAEIRETLEAPHLGAKNHSIPMVEPVHFGAQDVPVDPYLLGALLGDGHIGEKAVSLSGEDAEVVERCRLPSGVKVRHQAPDDRCQSWHFIGEQQGLNPMLVAMREMGLAGKLSHEKQVPEAYRFNSVEVRLEVLRGLMDTDGTVSKSGHSAYFTTVSPALADDVTFLVQSLGGKVSRSTKMPAYRHNGELRQGRESIQLAVSMPADLNPFGISRKAGALKPKTSYAPARYIVDVESVGMKEAQCIRVADDEHLYVTDDFIVTHNTFTLITGIMERRRLGLSRKPAIVVPNHLVVQWASEFYQLYPGARILAATPDDFSKKNRRRLFARIATGDYDAIIMGHSSFGFIEPPEADVRDVIAENKQKLEFAMEEAKQAGESGRSLKQMQKKLDTYDDRLKALAERERDEMGVDFAAMGIDYLAVDEAHMFKNLEYATSGERVVGMNDPKGSSRAFDLYTKLRGLQNRGGGVTFATGTPVSNSLVELYTMMRYLAPESLKARDQDHFDAWAGAYAVTETRMEYTATQKLKPRRVLSGLANLDGLGQMYREFADIITMDDLKRIYSEEKREANQANGTNERTEFPVPKVKHGGRQLDTGEITQQQSEYMDYLVARMQAIEENKRDPEYARIDNPLWVLSDARKMSLDIRVVDPTAQRDEDGKVMRSARKIKDLYDRWDADRGTQMVFSDLSTPSKTSAGNARKIIGDGLKVVFGEAEAKKVKPRLKNMSMQAQWKYVREAAERVMDDPAIDGEKVGKIEEYLEKHAFADSTMMVADTGFSVYDDLKQVLTEMGIPSHEIAFIHDYNTPDQKSRLFARVNSGAIRVLIGSTEKMGAGTNAQERLVGMHHLDAPWRPSDVEQREGRIIRQGNKLYERDPDNFEVEITAYSTNGTSDTVMWQVLERKAAAIEQFRRAGLDSMQEDGADSDQYAEFMATSTGNPVFKLKLEAERDLTNTQAEVGGKLIAVQNARSFMERYPERVESLTKRQADLKAMEPGDIVVGDQTGSLEGFDKAVEAAEAKFREDYAAWEKRSAEVEKAREVAAAAGKRMPGMPSAPSKPALMDDAITKQSGYALAIKTALEQVQEGAKDQGRIVPVRIGNIDLEVERRIRGNGNVSYQVNLKFPNGTISNIAHSEAKNPVDAPTLVNALTPKRIKEMIDIEMRSVEYGLRDVESRVERESKLAKEEVSEQPITDAQTLLDWYKDQVKIAEYEADIKRGERQNRYIAADRSRPIGQFKKRGEVEAKTFTVGGQTFTTTGLAAVEGGGRLTIHDATRDSDGAKALVYEQQEGQDAEPTISAVIEPAEARKQRRSATAQSNARQRRPRERMSALEVDQRIRQGRYGDAAGKLLDSGKVRIADTTPGDVPNSTAAYVDEQGVINLVARNLDPQYAEATLLHEAFHAGARPLIGNARWNELTERLGKLYRQAERSAGRNRQFWEAAHARIAAAEAAGDVMDDARRVEEFGAYALEEFASAPRTLRQWASEMAGRVKAWLQRIFGIQAGEVTPAQLRALAAAALRNGDMAPSPALAIKTDELVDRDGNPVTERERKAELNKAVRKARKALSVVQQDGVNDRDGGVVRDILKPTALLTQPYTIASMEPEFTPVFRTAQAQMRFRDTIISEMYPRFQAYKELRADSRAKVNKVLELGRLSGLSYSDARLKAGIENRGYKTVVGYDPLGRPMRRQEPLNAALTQPGEVTKLTQEEIAAYRELRTMFDEALDLFRDQTLIDMDMAEFVGSKDPVADILAAIDGEMSDAKKERYRNIAKMAEEIDQAKRTGYVPLARYGRFVVTVKEKIAKVKYAKNPEGGFIARGVPDTLADFMRDIGATWNDLEDGWQVSDGQRRQLARETTRTVYSEKLDPESYANRWETWRASKDGKRPDQLSFIKAAKARIEADWGGEGRRVSVLDTKKARLDGGLKLSDIDSLADMAQVDPATWENIRDDFVKAMKGRGFRKHFFRAEHVPGYEVDFERAIADYISGMAGYLARRHHDKQWETAIGNVRGPNLNEYSKEYRDYVNNPAEEHATLRQAGFLYYIAGNVSTALLNATQVPIMTMPALGQVMGSAKAAKHVTGAYKDALAMTSLYDQAREGYRRGGVAGAADNMLQMFDPNDAPEDVRAEVLAAWEDGMFSPQFTHEVMGFSNRRDGSAQAKLEKTIDYVASSYTYIERLNRLVTFIAAVRAAKDPKVRTQVATSLKGNHLARATLMGDNWSPKAFGEFIVDESQFMMGKVNRATILRSHGAAIFQFMSFVINSLQAWYRWSAVNGRDGKMATAYSIGAIAALSGVWGAPGAEYLRKAIEQLWLTLTGEDEDLRYNLREWVGRKTGSDMLGEIVDKGSFYPLGADMSGRIGFMRMLPDMTDPISMFGIPADLLIGRPSRAANAALQGNYGGAVAELAPNFLKNPITALEWSKKGVVSRGGNQAITPEQIPQHAYWYKALGIQPSIVSDAWEYKFAKSRLQRSTSDAKSRLVNKLARAEADATRNEDPARQPELEARIERLYQDVDEFNNEHPDEWLDPRTLQRRVRNKVNEYLYGFDQMGPVPSPKVERAMEVYNVDDMLERGRSDEP